MFDEAEYMQLKIIDETNRIEITMVNLIDIMHIPQLVQVSLPSYSAYRSTDHILKSSSLFYKNTLDYF